MSNKDHWPKEKRWADLGTRSEKVRRAQQLGAEHPRRDGEDLLAAERLRVLFVCSKNQWRSPTGEAIYRRHPLVEARSRGTSRSARRTVTAADLRWADVVVVMESKHAQRLRADFPGPMRHKDLHVLEIPDDYRHMDPELIELLERSMEPILASHGL